MLLTPLGVNIMAQEDITYFENEQTNQEEENQVTNDEIIEEETQQEENQVIDYTNTLNDISNKLDIACVFIGCCFLAKIYWEIHQNHD